MDLGRVTKVTGDCDVFLVALPGAKPSSGNEYEDTDSCWPEHAVCRREYRCVTWLSGVSICCWSLFVGRI